MPENNIVIEELVRALNRNYDRQQEELSRLNDRLETAYKNGTSEEVVSILTSAIDSLNESLSSQVDFARKTYESMVRRSGGREDLDPKMLKEVMDFKVKYAEASKKIHDIEEQLRSEREKGPAQNVAEVRKYEDLLRSASVERARIANIFYSKNDEGTYAREEAEDFIADLEEQERVIDSINKSQNVQNVNIAEATRLQKIYNDEVSTNAETWGIVKEVGSSMWKQVLGGAEMWMK